MDHLSIGRQGERLAVEFLNRLGYKIIEKNLKTKFGEIDIVCLEKAVIVFVEVKARTTSRYGDPYEAVDRNKQKRLSRAALGYLSRKRWEERIARFDVISILWKGPQPEINHIKDAFDLCMY